MFAAIWPTARRSLIFEAVTGSALSSTDEDAWRTPKFSIVPHAHQVFHRCRGIRLFQHGGFCHMNQSTLILELRTQPKNQLSGMSCYQQGPNIYFVNTDRTSCDNRHHFKCPMNGSFHDILVRQWAAKSRLNNTVAYRILYGREGALTRAFLSLTSTEAIVGTVASKVAGIKHTFSLTGHG